MTRFRPWIPAGDPVSIGEPPTPLVEGEAGVVYKLEGALPTGSFKDRGSAFLVGRLLAAGVSGITVDSSGNAGASLAAYGAAAGIAVRVFVPAHASGPKLSQMRAYGAEVVPVAGTRSDVGTAALAAATDELVYASHIWNPAFVLGTQTFAFELFEQLGAAPAAIVCPLGAGTLLLGCYYGFRSLVEAGLLDRMPAIVGVQSERCAPFVRAFAGAAANGGGCAPSIAEGILIAAPPRLATVVAAVRETGGAVVAVGEDAIAAATLRLARQGVYAEPTAAVPAAALDTVRGVLELDGPIVADVTATGLKSGAAIEELLETSTAAVR